MIPHLAGPVNCPSCSATWSSLNCVDHVKHRKIQSNEKGPDYSPHGDDEGGLEGSGERICGHPDLCIELASSIVEALRKPPRLLAKSNHRSEERRRGDGLLEHWCQRSSLPYRVRSGLDRTGQECIRFCLRGQRQSVNEGDSALEEKGQRASSACCHTLSEERAKNGDREGQAVCHPTGRTTPS